MKKMAFITSAIAIALLSVVIFTDGTLPDLAANAINAAQNKSYAECVSEFSEKEVGEFEFIKVDLNGDGLSDAILKSTMENGCGTAGCVHEICIQKRNTNFDHVNFGFAAHTIEVKEAMTNGMKDLGVNHKDYTTLVWDGERYVLEAY